MKRPAETEALFVEVSGRKYPVPSLICGREAFLNHGILTATVVSLQQTNG